jgi:hypothetical protein
VIVFRQLRRAKNIIVRYTMDKEKLIKLNAEMALLSKRKKEFDKRIKTFEEANATLKSLMAVSGDKINVLKSELSVEAEEEFDKTGNKKLDGGIGIRVSKTVEYPADKALAWAKEKDMFLQLDDKAFKKAASGLNLDFVEQVEKITVTFPKEIVLDAK